MSATPKNIQLVGNQLAISWSDQLEHYFPLNTLRRACPCAVCGGEPDVMGRILRPEVRYVESSFQISKMNIVGGYALQVQWGDGHNTGLYSWKYLRALGLYLQEGHKPWDDGEETGCCDHHDEHEHHCEHGHNPNEPHHCCGGHGHSAGHCKNK